MLACACGGPSSHQSIFNTQCFFAHGFDPKKTKVNAFPVKLTTPFSLSL
jgi:hypothetical protein